MRSSTERRRSWPRRSGSFAARLDQLGFDATPPALIDPLRTLVVRHEARAGSPLPRTTAVASPLPGEDTDIVAHALSALVARDFERRVCRVVGSSPGSVGTTDRTPRAVRDLVNGTAKLSEALRFATGEPRLATLRLDDPWDAVVPVHDIRRLVERLGTEFDHVVLEAPGLLAHHASELAVGESDGFVLVVRRGASTEGQVASATALAASRPCLGAVLTDSGRRPARRGRRSGSRRR